MDFELSPWADEPEIYRPTIKPIKVIASILPDSGPIKLPQLAPVKEDLRTALSRSIAQPSGKLRSHSNRADADSFYGVSPIELRAKLAVIAASQSRIGNSSYRYNFSSDHYAPVPMRRLDQLIATSIKSLKAKKTSLGLNSSLYLRGSRPTYSSKLKPL